MKRHLPILTLVIDALIGGFVLFSAIWLFCGSNGMPEAGPIDLLKYFTVQSNILLGLVAFAAIPFDVLVLWKKRKSPRLLRILFLAFSMATTLTFLVVMTFLGPTMGYGFMLEKANLFMHLLTPLLGVVRVLLLETNEDKPSWKWAFFGIVHMSVYGVVYIINCAAHNGYGTLEYDWYGFGKGGLGIGVLVYFGILVSLFFVTYGLVRLQNLLIIKIRRCTAEDQEI